MSKTNMKKFQSFQNRCIRYITKNTGLENLSIEDQHKSLKVEPTKKKRFKKRAEDTMERFSITHEDLHRQFISENENGDSRTTIGGRGSMHTLTGTPPMKKKMNKRGPTLTNRYMKSSRMFRTIN